MTNLRECVEQTEHAPALERAGDDDGSSGPTGVTTTEAQAPWRERLERVIEAEIIPRLMLSHHPAPVTDAPGRLSLSPGDLDEFARILTGNELVAASDYVQSLRRRGLSIESLFLDVLAPAARHLGEMWSQDLCDFVDVTVGVARLQNLLREFNPAFRSGMEEAGGPRRILLLPAPGEQHSFGLAMVEKFFRSFGWDVAGGAGCTADDVVDLASSESFGVIGFSVSSTVRLESLASTIRTVRKVSRNPSVGIMVGGSIFQQQPELVVLIGADATAPDGFTAVLLAQSLLDMRVRAC